ncbi:uncharacterized protein LOC123447118 isoform X3 [Hordeum vulgare subsp. vulgare]|uniref:uncharacterized protein LOC123447118 isoform X3 n=1 Tax=Hordeum vulgare subsp. vulgare TaxID=112509 RepID=UPI001D1A424F|nr:uncharacterized protein LOC123447118 isoform X3 [Hordeum vulgare subsp. vulgare]
MEITTHTDPEVDVQGFDALSVNTTPATGVVDHSVSFLVPGDPAALTLTRCSTKYSCRDTNRLRAMMEPKLRPTPWPLFKFNQETIQLELQWASFSVSGVVTLETGPDVTEDSYEQTFYNTPCCGSFPMLYRI